MKRALPCLPVAEPRIASRVGCLIVLSLAPAALAAPTDPIYVAAKQAYAKGDCPVARPLLTAYLNKDTAYLGAHPDERRQVIAAINYCDRQMAPAFGASGLTANAGTLTFGASGKAVLADKSTLDAHGMKRPDAKALEQSGRASVELKTK